MLSVKQIDIVHPSARGAEKEQAQSLRRLEQKHRKPAHVFASRVTTASSRAFNPDQFVRCCCTWHESQHLYMFIVNDPFVMLNQSNLFLLRTSSQFVEVSCVSEFLLSLVVC